MTFTEEQVEWIVLEVIRRLGLAESAAPQPQPAVAHPGPAAPQPGPTPAELRLTEKLVTLRTLDGRLGGVSRVVVARRAVVTPAVKDELRRRKIELVFAN
jgi:hypothetical protein